jgi:glycosyltransferase involved in cell wall biosynthesis
VLTCSREIHRQIELRRGHRSFFVPNGIHLRKSASANLLVRRESVTKTHYRRRVCFAGRCVAKKGLSIVREAAIAFPDVQFTIAGIGPINPAEWNLPNVETLGWIDRSTLTALFEQSDLLLLPSRGEGFPLAAQEAMASGLPCALFDETWSAWGKDALFFHLLPDEGYLSKLGEILRHPRSVGRREQLSAYALENWDWRQATESYACALHAGYAARAPGAALFPLRSAGELKSI